MTEAALSALPRDDRRRLRVLVGSWKMLAAQLRELGPVYRERGLLPEPEVVDMWRDATNGLYLGSQDDPEEAAPERPTTLGT